jgi:hypothetical protein
MRTYSTSSGSDILSSFEQLTISSSAHTSHVSSHGDQPIHKSKTSAITKPAAPKASTLTENLHQRSRQPAPRADIQAWAIANAKPKASSTYSESSRSYNPNGLFELCASDLDVDDYSDAASDVTATFTGSRPSRRRGHLYEGDIESLMSAEDARSSIDAWVALGMPG